MQHAFAQNPVERAQPAAPVQRPWTRRDVALLGLCSGPVLLVIWLCSIQHNWQRGADSIRHSLGLAPAAGAPLFLLGSAAGFVLVLGVTIIGGTATAAQVLSQRLVWIIILLPELAWAAPLAMAWLVRPLGFVLQVLAPAPSPQRSGAFE